jgi:hypothetical protein
MHSPSPLGLVGLLFGSGCGWAPALIAAFAPFFVTGKPHLPALDALVDSLQRSD